MASSYQRPAGLAHIGGQESEDRVGAPSATAHKCQMHNCFGLADCNLFAQLAHFMATHSHFTSQRTGDANGSYFLAGLCLWWYINAPAECLARGAINRSHLKPTAEEKKAVVEGRAWGHRDCCSVIHMLYTSYAYTHIKRLVICYLTLLSILLFIFAWERKLFIFIAINFDGQAGQAINPTL